MLRGRRGAVVSQAWGTEGSHGRGRRHPVRRRVATFPDSWFLNVKAPETIVCLLEVLLVFEMI